MLKITKKGDKYWLFEDSEMGLFSPSKFTINLLNNAITIVYENGLKSKNYNVIDCEIYDLGATSPFTTSSGDLFMQKLEELNCPCFQKNENIFNISGGAWGDITGTLSNQTDLQTALDYKLDKVSTAGVERAYIINADGSQGTKATSEFKDVLEFANLAAFPVTGETSKIYLALDTNKTYRWSGSAYVQIGGGTEVDIFNPYTSDYFIGTIRPQGQGLTSFILSGFNNSWTASGTLEAFSEVSEYTLVGVKSATTSGASCQFTNSGNITIRTYQVNRINKVIHWQIFRNSDPAPVADARFFVGIINRFTTIGNTNPSTHFNLIGVGADSGDTNIQVIHNDQSGVATKIDLGVNFPANTQNVDTYLSQTFFDIPNAKAYIRLVRLNTGHEVITQITTNLPAMSSGWDLGPVFWRNNGTNALEVKMRIGSYLQGQKIM
jgi:hypothetical protein